MSKIPPFPDLSNVSPDEVLCFKTCDLSEKEITNLRSLLDESWQRKENQVHQPRPRQFKHFNWLPATMITLRNIYKLGIHLHSKSINSWIASDALSGRDTSVMVVQLEPIDKSLKIGRVLAKDAGKKVAVVAHNPTSFEQVIDGKVSILRDFDAPYGSKDAGLRELQKAPRYPSIPLSPKASEKQVVFTMLTPLEEEDPGKLQQRFLGYLGPDVSECNIIPWENAHEASRADIFSMLFEANDWGYSGRSRESRYLFFIDAESLHKNEVIFAQAIKVNNGIWDSKRFIELSRAPADKLAGIRNVSTDGANKGPSWTHTIDNFVKDKTMSETIYDPNSEYSRRRPVYLPQEEPEGGAPPLFFLKNDFTKEERNVILDELKTQAMEGEDYPNYCLVPWTRDTEGSTGDIVKIMAHLHLRGDCQYPIFIDSQTPRDRTVIMAQCAPDEEGINPETKMSADDGEYEGKPGFQQVQWGRIAGREAHINWVSLDVANQSFEVETVEIEKVVVKSDSEMQELAAEVNLPEREGEWREIWDEHVVNNEGINEGKRDGDDDDGDEGPSRKKKKQ